MMQSSKSDSLLDFVTAAPEERVWPNVVPKDSASLIVIDDPRRGKAKVLMGRRHSAQVFMPGKFVFPGGRIEGGDHRMSAVGSLHPRVEAALSARASPWTSLRGRALALAAIRETFEETGILIGTRTHDAPERTPPGTWTAFRNYGVLPDLGPITLVARAITPPRLRRRFDTRFFAVHRTSIAADLEDVVGANTELVELVWVTLGDALQLELAEMTQVVLTDLHERLQKGFSPELPVPFYYERRGKLWRAML